MDTGWSSGCDAVSLSDRSGLGWVEDIVSRDGVGMRIAVRR